MGSPSQILNSLQFDLSQISGLLEVISSNDGEINSEVETRIRELLDSKETKVDTIEYLLGFLESQGKLWRERAKQMEAVAIRMETAHDRVFNTVKEIIVGQHGKPLVGVNFRFSIRNSKPSVIIEDETQIDDVFKKRKIVESPDKEMIRKAIESGILVRGAKLQTNYSLRIDPNVKMVLDVSRKETSDAKAGNAAIVGQCGNAPSPELAAPIGTS